MLSITVPLLVCFVGALVYGLANGKVSTLGLVAFAVGLFCAVAALAGTAFHLR